MKTFHREIRMNFYTRAETAPPAVHGGHRPTEPRSQDPEMTNYKCSASVASGCALNCQISFRTKINRWLLWRASRRPTATLMDGGRVRSGSKRCSGASLSPPAPWPPARRSPAARPCSRPGSSPGWPQSCSRSPSRSFKVKSTLMVKLRPVAFMRVNTGLDWTVQS